MDPETRGLFHEWINKKVLCMYGGTNTTGILKEIRGEFCLVHPSRNKEKVVWVHFSRLSLEF
jgi:hypothetical protein